MKYIKRNLQIVEPKINNEGYYVVGNIAIHPDVFHRDYQPLGFTLTAEEVEYLKDDLEFKKLVKAEPLCDIEQNLLTRIKQYQDEYNK